VGRRGDHRQLIDLLDALAGADAAAFISDEHGPVANPAVPCGLRNLMHHVAELRFERDGRYPGWWRAVGEQP
jgi:hypothetical protein